MDLGAYNNEELFFSAIRAEIGSKEVYQKLADGVNNAFLKDKLKFLASEEDKHRSFLENAYLTEFPGRDIELPGSSPVPLPEISLPNESVPVSEVIESAMKAELAAQEFYLAFAESLEDNPELVKTLKYFASMELGHYNILEVELKNIETYEEYDDYWPMMHAGT